MNTINGPGNSSHTKRLYISYLKVKYVCIVKTQTGKEQVKCFLISYSGVSLVIKFSLEVYLMRLIRRNGW